MDRISMIPPLRQNVLELEHVCPACGSTARGGLYCATCVRGIADGERRSLNRRIDRIYAAIGVELPEAMALA